MPKAREPFKSMTYGDVGRVYREKLGGPFYPVVPNPPPKPKWFCEAHGCTRYSDPNTGETGGTCASYCLLY